jgi:peptidoglycan/xylan/chitin deacetylase (PgdA/CDA1 family)
LETLILLTFDLEEFDLPLEYGLPISEEEQIAVSNTGIQRLTKLLSKYNIPATFFTTSFYASKNKELIKNLSASHEIASHSKNHSSFKDSDLPDSKMELEQITGKSVNGFRMPRFAKVDKTKIKSAGYYYDSSINPTFIPGRYNNIQTPRKFYTDNESNLIEIPVSVSPVIRFPLFWLSFKNIPFQLYLSWCRRTIRKDSYLNLYFHPWEFADLESFKIPAYIKDPSGNVLIERFEKLISGLKETGDFSTISSFLGFPLSE